MGPAARISGVVLFWDRRSPSLGGGSGLLGPELMGPSVRARPRTVWVRLVGGAPVGEPAVQESDWENCGG